jgi:bifunctional DNA-binding transcriptional regulator/antitoxin component of YhaV-PrlF toxin-antitoxin module
MTLRYRAKVGKNGMFPIPKEKQKELGLKPGDLIDVSLDIPGSTSHKQNQNRSHRFSAMGKYAGILSSEEFMREKQKEIDLEEKKFQR